MRRALAADASPAGCHDQRIAPCMALATGHARQAGQAGFYTRAAPTPVAAPTHLHPSGSSPLPPRPSPCSPQPPSPPPRPQVSSSQACHVISLSSMHSRSAASFAAAATAVRPHPACLEGVPLPRCRQQHRPHQARGWHQPDGGHDRCRHRDRRHPEEPGVSACSHSSSSSSPQPSLTQQPGGHRTRSLLRPHTPACHCTSSELATPTRVRASLALAAATCARSWPTPVTWV